MNRDEKITIAIACLVLALLIGFLFGALATNIAIREELIKREQVLQKELSRDR